MAKYFWASWVVCGKDVTGFGVVVVVVWLVSVDMAADACLAWALMEGHSRVIGR